MAITAKDTGTGTDFDPIPMGMHHGVCYAAIDIGTQPQFGNFPSRRKLIYIWEIPAERIEFVKDGVKKNLPRAISEKYTISLASKGNLRPMLESWRGRAFTPEELEGFDVSNVVGANCLLNIVHEHGKGDKANRIYANVASVNPLMKGTPKLKPENPTIVFSMEDIKGPITIPEAIPEWIAALIKQSDEYQARLNNKHQPAPVQSAPVEIVDEDVPF